MEYFSGFLRHEGTEITHNLKEECHQKDWVVYAKRPFGGPEQVIEYLGRYTHKTCTERSRSVAISNHRLQSMEKIRHYGLLASRNKPALKQQQIKKS